MQKASLRSPPYIFVSLPSLALPGVLRVKFKFKRSKKSPMLCQIIPRFPSPERVESKRSFYWATRMTHPPLPNHRQNVQGERKGLQWGPEGRIVWNIPHGRGMAWETRWNHASVMKSALASHLSRHFRHRDLRICSAVRIRWSEADPVVSAFSVPNWWSISLLAPCSFWESGDF